MEEKEQNMEVVRERGKIHHEIESMSKRIVALESNISRLHSILSPILIREISPDTEAGGSLAETPSSELTGALRNYKNQIYDLNARICDIIDTVDL